VKHATRAFIITQCLLALCLCAPGDTAMDERLPDSELFDALNLDFPGMQDVKAAVAAGDYPRARTELARYYRSRKGDYWWLNPHEVDRSPKSGAQCLKMAQQIADRTGAFDESRWLANGELDWLNNSRHANLARMYLWQSLGVAYWHSGTEEPAARVWVDMLRSWVKQCPPGSHTDYWNTMTTGIRMRSGWPYAFNYFLLSETFTDDDLVLMLKSTLEQTRHLRADHSATSNWLTFEMAGLYSSGVLYPELKEAADWRQHAASVAVADMDQGYLPDGSSIELCPGYHQFFSNYLLMYDLALEVGRESEDGIGELLAKCEGPFSYYVKLMAPDRMMPAYNDNGPLDAKKQLQAAVKRFPDRQDFLWIATDGAQGGPPQFTSCFLPYAGAAAMRSGWQRDANYLGLDFGPVGYRHAHQDKLNVVLWAYGRQILFDPGKMDYSDTPHGNYCTDTFSHNTALVDNRPQRRRWYQHPSPKRMPYKPVEDVQWQSTDAQDWAAGVYDGPYGMPGPSDSYPYKKGGNFYEGWAAPATHYRQALFLKPDIFIIADTLVPKDAESHEYDVRWHLDSTATIKGDGGHTVTTTDPEAANLQIVPLLCEGLSVRATVTQSEPEFLGWKVTKTNEPATTVQHIKTGSDTVRFVTLLLPLRKGQAGMAAQASHSDGGEVSVALGDGRTIVIHPPASPQDKLSATPAR